MTQRIPLFFACLLSLLSQSNAAQVDTAEIFSPSMRKIIRCIIFVPETHSPVGLPVPSLYLLHGWSGSYASWPHEAPQLQTLADAYRMLIVCADGGYDSWYLDSPVDTNVRYETHLTKELIVYVDHFYNTIREPAGRAIVGVSMGGHGAMYLAARHPELYGAAGSLCGRLDLRSGKRDNLGLRKVLGDPARYPQHWEDHSVVNLVPQFWANKQTLVIDCGVGDYFIQLNRDMHKRLLEADVPHSYTERAGEHNKAYWADAIDYVLLSMHKFFNRRQP